MVSSGVPISSVVCFVGKTREMELGTPQPPPLSPLTYRGWRSVLWLGAALVLKPICCMGTIMIGAVKPASAIGRPHLTCQGAPACSSHVRMAGLASISRCRLRRGTRRAGSCSTSAASSKESALGCSARTPILSRKVSFGGLEYFRALARLVFAKSGAPAAPLPFYPHCSLPSPFAFLEVFRPTRSALLSESALLPTLLPHFVPGPLKKGLIRWCVSRPVSQVTVGFLSNLWWDRAIWMEKHPSSASWPGGFLCLWCPTTAWQISSLIPNPNHFTHWYA